MKLIFHLAFALHTVVTAGYVFRVDPQNLIRLKLMMLFSCVIATEWDYPPK